MEFGASPQRSQDKTAKLESSHEDSPGDDSDDDVFDSVPYMLNSAEFMCAGIIQLNSCAEFS
jgi:hypothetical protein